MTAEKSQMRRYWLLPLSVLCLAAASPARAYTAYVSNEKGNTVSVVDTDKWAVTATIKVGQRPRGIEFTRDGKFVMVAVGDDDTIQVIDTKTQKVEKYLLVGQRVWQMAFTPDEKYLLTTNGLSNDISVIDVADQKVIKSIQVGRLPWGVAVAAQ